MSAKSRDILILMHSWTAPIQEGIAQFLVQQPAWHCTRIDPIPECFQYISQQRYDGAITWLETPYLPQVRALHIPVVDVSGWIPEIPFARVLNDDKAIGRQAAQHLMDLGLQNFAVVDRINDPLFSALRRESFIAALRAEGHTCTLIRPLPAAMAGADLSTNADSPLRAWLRKLPYPLGIFAVDDNLALDVLEDCRRLQIQVPDDVAVIGVGNEKLAAPFAKPPLTSIATPEFQIGLEAARLLDRLMAGQPQPQTPLLLPPIGVITRQSTDMLAIDDENIRSAVRYIRQHIQTVTVSRLLREVPMNRRYLERKFVELIGRSPHQEIRHQRIAQCKSLLAQTNLDMPAIARRCGFANAKRLANVFRAMTGQTPTEYRRNFRYPKD